MAEVTRRGFVAGIGAAAGSLSLGSRASARLSGPVDLAAPYRTPYKYGRLVLSRSGEVGAFDEKAVDQPFLFTHDGRYFMTFVGWDGKGYQTGLAESSDLVNWKRTALILARDLDDPITRWNIATSSILRENELESPGRLVKVNGRYVCAWHAYPSPGYEIGPAVIGLAWSDDLIHWERGEPILTPEAGGWWEEGGLYKPWLMKSGDLYYIFYNAKTKALPWKEQTGMAWSRDLKSWTRHAANPILRNGPPGAPDHRFASDPVVLRRGDEWAMFYFGLAQDGKARDLIAIGRDLNYFSKLGEVMIDTGPPGSVDSVYAHKPAIISRDSVLYHYYCAVSGAWPNETRGISVARSVPW